MKRFIFTLALIAAGLVPAAAQQVSIKWVSSLPATCAPGDRARVLAYKYTATTGIYYCSAANTWTQVGTSTMSYPALASDGSASAPAFSFSSDTDVGMYRSGANTLNFATGGTLRATLSSAGLWTTTGGVSTTTGAFTGQITSTQGTITTSQPFATHTATWNDGGVTFKNIFSNVTDSASAAGSQLIALQVGGSDKFAVTKAGAATLAAGLTATTGTFSGAVNKVTITAPAIGSTLTIADGKTLTASNSLTLTGTDSTTITFQGSDTYVGRATTDTLTNKTLTSPVLTTPAIGVATGTSLAATGAITSSGATAGIGYATGAGGAQTQATSKSTGVTSNTITTAITMNAAALAADTTVAFTFTNSSIAATDTVLCTHQSAGTSAAYVCNAFPGAGSAVVSVRNVTAGSLSEAIVLRVTVIKSVSN